VKTAETDNINAELLQVACPHINQRKPETNIWRSERMTNKWNMSTICPI
jgi:hypothetical protein